jgi:hypothetical protein
MTDKGYIFAGPKMVEKSQTFKTGRTLVAYHQQGIIVSENSASPWHHATLFAQGTFIRDPGGEDVGEVVLWETVDPDGDLTWAVTLWIYAAGPAKFQLIQATGKWAGIAGEGQTLGLLRERADDHYMVNWDMHRRFDR